MNALEELQIDSSRRSTARFFLRVGQTGRAKALRDEYTLPIFPLPLILDAEGMLAREARHLVDDEADYLRRCEALIKGLSLE